MLNNIFKWPGQSGKEYSYFSYKMGGKLIKAPGNYILTTLENGFWIALYIGQTEDLSEELLNHDIGKNSKNTTTHVHVHANHSRGQRLMEVEDLVTMQRPSANNKYQQNYQYSYAFKVGPSFIMKDSF